MELQEKSMFRDAFGDLNHTKFAMETRMWQNKRSSGQNNCSTCAYKNLYISAKQQHNITKICMELDTAHKHYAAVKMGCHH